MMLSELLRKLCALIPLTITLPDDVTLETPSDLMNPEVHHIIGDAVTQAALKQYLSFRASVAFGEWLASLCTGWPTRYSNEDDVLMLDAVFGHVVFGNQDKVIIIYLLPNWEALDDYLVEIQEGVVAVFEEARVLFDCEFTNEHDGQR